MNLDDIRRALLKSPMANAAISATLAVGIGVFSGSLIAEITTSKGLEWSIVFKTFSLYALAAFTGAQMLYTKTTYERDQQVLRFADQEYCIAYMRAKCLPEMAAKAQERIRNGQGGEFNAAMDEIKQVLK